MVMAGKTANEPVVPEFEPEPVESMRRRLRAALETVYDYALGEETEHPWPGELRRNIFDFSQGFRLVISSGSLRPGEPPAMHLTMFIRPDGDVAADLLSRDPLSNAANIAMLARAAVQSLFDDAGMPLTCIAFAAPAVAVFAGEDRDECLRQLDRMASSAEGQR